MKTQLTTLSSFLFDEQNTSVLFTYARQNPVNSRSQLLFLTACCCLHFYRWRSTHAALQWPPPSSPTPLARTRWRRRHEACSGCLRANNRCSSVARVPNTRCLLELNTQQLWDPFWISFSYWLCYIEWKAHFVVRLFLRLFQVI